MLGKMLKSGLAGVGVFGFFMSYLNLLNNKTGFYLSENWTSVLYLFLIIGLTGAVSSILIWSYSQIMTLFNLTMAFLIIDSSHWGLSSLNQKIVLDHTAFVAELSVISAGIVLAMILSFILGKTIGYLMNNRVSLDTIKEQPKASATMSNILKLIIGTLLGVCLVKSVSPALTQFMPNVLVHFLIFLVICIILRRLMTVPHPFLTVLMFLSWTILIHSIAALYPTNPETQFLQIIPPYTYTGLVILGSIIPMAWHSNSKRRD